MTRQADRLIRLSRAGRLPHPWHQPYAYYHRDGHIFLSEAYADAHDQWLKTYGQANTSRKPRFRFFRRKGN